MTSNLPKPINRVLLLEPNLVHHVWGGSWIARLKGVHRPSMGDIGESWEFSGHADHPGQVRLENGKTAFVRDIIPEAPILIKLIDAQDNLSLQVHPPDDYARIHENSSGKSESWLILETDLSMDGGFIYLGFDPAKRAPFKKEEDFKKAFLESPLSFVNKIRVQPGDMFHVPPGTIHAIGRGVRLFEIQQSSGVTYRLWDWGRPRELHIEKALDILQFTASLPVSNAGLDDSLGHYGARVIALEKKGGASLQKTNGLFFVLTAISGDVRILQSGQEDLILRVGHSALVPAAVNEVNLASASERAVVVKSFSGKTLH